MRLQVRSHRETPRLKRTAHAAGGEWQPHFRQRCSRDGSPRTESYQRDATGAVVQRTLTPNTGSPTVYRYSGPFILDGFNALIETDLSLPGGVSVEIPVSGAQSWSYPDLHGDNIIQCDGARVGGLASYDPHERDFANPVRPFHMRIAAA